MMKGNRPPMKWGPTAGAFALGAAAGSAAALLFAPASGSVTRRRISQKFRAIERDTARQIQRAKRALVKRAGLLKQNAAEKLEDTREWLAERVASRNGKNAAPRRLVPHA